MSVEVNRLRELLNEERERSAAVRGPKICRAAPIANVRAIFEEGHRLVQAKMKIKVGRTLCVCFLVLPKYCSPVVLSYLYLVLWNVWASVYWTGHRVKPPSIALLRVEKERVQFTAQFFLFSMRRAS